MPDTQKEGEVIEPSTTGFTAECYELYQSPPLGSLVRTADSETELYAVVCGATTSSVEPGRRPIARGRGETSEEEIYRANPQLAKLLRSEFSALVVGHKENGKVHHYLPPKPARIHHFIFQCSPEEVKEFSQSFAFLNILLGTHQPVPTEELVSACLRQMGQVQDNPHAFLVTAGKELAVLLNGDFNRLKAILERIKQ
ncbi:MAG: hypothetical protein HYX90_09300 [Chloroflexi bacterium]|nr:hypothetical protein [Chloroflexota bacterium]